MNSVIRFSLGLSVLATGTPVASQPLIPFVQPNVPSAPEVKPLPPLEELLPSIPPTPLLPAPTPSPEAERFTVRRFDVVGNTVLSPKEIERVLAPFIGRPITFAELLQAQDAVTELYREQGYITSGAFIPPQKLENNVVQIEVIEGQVEAINIEGLSRLHPAYVQSRLELAVYPVLNQKKLLKALQLLQLNPLFENLSAELSAGTQPGLSVLDIKFKEAKAFSAQISFDNQQISSIGSLRALGEITHNNLLGWGDRLNLRYFNTQGSNTIDELSYTLPINARDGTISASFYYTTSKIIQTPFDQLDITYQSPRLDLTYRQPLYQAPSKEFAVGLTSSFERSQTSVLNLLQGESNLFVLRPFQEFFVRSNRDVLALRSQFSYGPSAVVSTVNGDTFNDSFFVWRGQMQYVRILRPETILLLRSDVQLSPQALPPVEQFSVGGISSVRGYANNTILSDNGIFASIEIRTPLLRVPRWNTLVKVAAFSDFATVWNNSQTELIANNLYSVGLGLHLSIGDRVNGRMDWGIPLVNFQRAKNNWQENGLYFSLSYKF
jgi:hemolysin activation/secretion protein